MNCIIFYISRYMSLSEAFLGSSFDQGREHYEGVWEGHMSYTNLWIELSLSILNCSSFLLLLMKGIFFQ